jgi:RHS repeat-associated protein
MPGAGTRTNHALVTHSIYDVGFDSNLNNTFRRTYHYDQTGRIDQVVAPNNPINFAYDTLGRLSSRTVQTCAFVFYAIPSDTLSGPYGNCGQGTSVLETFTYDAMGNRTDLGGAPTTGNRYVTFNGASYSYDNDGNVIQKIKSGSYNRQYHWNTIDQLDTAIKDGGYPTSFDYNAFGKPVRIKDGDASGGHVAKYLLWDGDALVAAFLGNGQRDVDYVYLPGTIDHPFASTVGATTPTAIRYQEEDELNNVVGTDQAGAVSQSDSYDAWGTVTSTSSDSHLFWKGLFWNSDSTGLYFMRNRWYDPEGGRFVNEDPAGFAGGINLYAFGGNDPINGFDPSGLSAGCPQDAVAKARLVNGAPDCADLVPVKVDGNGGTGGLTGGIPPLGDGGGLPTGLGIPTISGIPGGTGRNLGPEEPTRTQACLSKGTEAGVALAEDLGTIAGVGFAVKGLRGAELLYTGFEAWSLGTIGIEEFTMQGITHGTLIKAGKLGFGAIVSAVGGEPTPGLAAGFREFLLDNAPVVNFFVKLRRAVRACSGSK